MSTGMNRPATGTRIRFRIGTETVIVGEVCDDDLDYVVSIRPDGTSQRAMFLREDMRDIEVLP